MSKSDPTASEIARYQDASEWVQRLSESNEQALADQWMQWCRSDPLNLPAFEQMQRVWDGFSGGQDSSTYRAHLATRLKRPNRLIALAASVVLLIGLAGWLALRYSEVLVIETPIGGQRRITLSDGSHLELAPDSLVKTRFTVTQRDVQLERGQAFFAVAHSALRPFVVHVNGLTVTAVGTAFDVRIDPGSTVVTVSEGRVKVAPAADEADAGPKSDAETVRANVGQRVTFSRSAHRLSVAAIDPKIAGSWREGTLKFVGEPLEDVVGVVNRYVVAPIVLAAAFQQTRFTGTVSPSNVHDWLIALEQIYAVQVVDQGPNGILIRSRADDGAPK